MLLFDQNISYRIVKKLKGSFPKSVHVSKLGLPNPASDLDIWDYAKTHQLMVVTFDEDYSNILTLRGAPPKIIWLRFGNSSTAFIAEKLIHNQQNILDLDQDPDLDLLEVY